MNNLLLYLAESSLALLLFYVVYALLLSRQTCFKFNRFYLLAALLFSFFIIPFLEISLWPAETTVSTNNIQVQPATADIIYGSPILMQTPTQAKTPNYGAWLYGLYVSGVLVAVIFFCGQFLKLYTFIYSHAADGYYWQRIKIIPTHGEMATFSFLHYILFDNSQPFTPTEKELVFRHEQAHLLQKHTFDIIYLKVLTIIFWFNPLLYFYKKALESTHEYLADAQVLEDEDAETYATLLVQQVFYKTNSSLGNFFHLHQSLTLKRLIMMKNLKKPFSIIRPLLTLAVVCAFAAVFAANRPVSLPDLIPAAPTNNFAENSGLPLKTQSVAGVLVPDEISEPAFQDGKEQLYRFLLQHLKFKPEAFGKDATRRTVVSIKIDKEGNPENAFAASEDLVNQEITRVIRLMPPWIPAYQDGKGLASRYELHLLLDQKAKHSVITPNKLVKKGALDAEGLPTFSSDVIHLGVNSVTGTPKNFLDQEAIVVGEITEPSFPGGQATMERYFRENIQLANILENMLADKKTSFLGISFHIQIDEKGNVIKLPFRDNDYYLQRDERKPDENSSAEEVNRRIFTGKFHNEVRRVINNMPQWSPAIKDGKPIRANVSVYVGMLHAPEPPKPQKRNEIYHISRAGEIIFHTDQIVFWFPLKDSNQKKNEGNQTTQEIKLPKFPGGESEMYKFLSKNIKYPAGGLAQNNGFTWVMTTVKIDKNGNPETYDKSIKDPFIREAYRVNNLLPKFEPAMQNGEPVASDYIIPIYFRYSSDTTRINDNRNHATFEMAKGVPTVKSRPIVVTIYTDKSAPDEAAGKNILNGDKRLKPVGSQKLPQFPGGKNKLSEFLSSHTQYPATALKSKLAGQAIVQATLNADGTINNFKTLHTDHAYFEEEAISVLREMPRWEPALQDGKAVSYNLVFPFVFALESKQNIPALRLPANRSQLYVQDAITIIGYSQVIAGQTIVKKETLPTRNSIKPQNPIQDNDKVFTFVEQQPAFPGGEAALNKFIKENLKYPAEAQRKGVSGLVVAQFTIDKTGKILNPLVVKRLGSGTDDETLRLIKLMPNFNPARQNGKPVSFRYTLPVRFAPPVGAPTKGTSAAPAQTMPDKVFTFVEQMPVFPGGEAALNKFIKENLKYPAEAQSKSISGLVVAQFTVDKTGKIHSPQIVKPLGAGADEEAIRLIKLIPDFKPAKQNGRSVNFRYTLPIRFGLATEAETTKN